ncbi:alpha-glucuronidase family glycosyl hydrolase [Phenylobacterium deserti]|uniref:Xylan alpha-1,2-glucuronidase n=1 Tax=Phenylobacterium deserti TaxID=1914756 RepID=A0A328A9X8_9CAUL|nr:alpha-glucuronidase family glycosyl hydrolase [Phenylobacterium deserti]RAK51335.1 alpha-glucuronidase [Phenylobacterium deserti]
MKLLARLFGAFLIALLGVGSAAYAQADDGYDLWLRYRPIEARYADAYRTAATEVVVQGSSPTLLAARAELNRGLSGLLGAAPLVSAAPTRDGAVVVGTPASSPLIASLRLPLDKVGPEGFIIRSAQTGGRRVTVVAANSDVGALYGAFRFLQMIQTRQPLERVDVVDAPKVKIRVLNHWDNLDRHVERGYSGQSIWDWWRLPDYKDPRYTDYARANASLGINGTVLNNVNAKADSLTEPYLRKAAAVADVLRPYGMKVYLSARFSAPIEIGGLKTADPQDPQVRAFWKAKADEIYRIIPDFGGFLVKANSEGQPGPGDYKRSHAEGANMLAEAVAPHGGIVMWRAFVYSHELPEDRIKQAYNEFKPLDGQFRDNVIVQVKNGPLDFQPREPFSPLFGATPKTPLMMEFQVTKEYLGFSTHLVYLGAYFEEALKADTWQKGKGSTVAKVVDGRMFGHRLTGMAGVANIGTDRNWAGSIFDQANWYAYGRLAWNPEASSRAIAEEWARQTFSNDPAFVTPVVDMMMKSRETVVNYMTPLGLTHIMGTGHHYGPAPWVSEAGRADWTPVYYHRASPEGIGFDRMKTGSNAIAQYAPQAGKELAADEKNLLWFHRVKWDDKTQSGRTVWDELVVRYTQGVQEVAQMRRTWEGMKPYVDADRYEQVADYLAIQEKEAQWWRDACIAYFQSFSKRPLPAGYAPPAHDLEYYKSLEFPYAPGRG